MSRSRDRRCSPGYRPTPGEDVVAAVGDGDALLVAGRASTSPISSSSTFGCRRPSPTKEFAPPWRCARARRAQPILVFSQYVEERYASELLAGDAAGIGYLLKERVADVGDFVDACRALPPAAPCSTPRSSPSCSPARRNGVRSTISRHASGRCSGLMAEGRSNVGIAPALVSRDGAVEKHISSIFSKLGLATPTPNTAACSLS